MEETVKEKQVKDYLHLYLGCGFKYPDDKRTFTLDSVNLRDAIRDGGVPILRKLSDMTEEEAWEFVGGKSTLYDEVTIDKIDHTGIEIAYVIDAGEEGKFPQSHKVSFFSNTSKEFIWLLSKGFDLFGLIPDGLAIDKATLPPIKQ